MYDTMQRWDAGEYYYKTGNACKDYDGTISSFLYNFAVCYHVNYGFSSLLGTVLFWNWDTVIGVNLLQIFLSVLSCLALFDMFCGLWRMNTLRAFFGALMVSMIPIFFGLSVYTTPDYYVILFFIYAMYFGYKRQHILEAFMMIYLSFTKETGVLIIFGYYSFILLYIFFASGKKIKERVLNVIKSPDLWIAMSVAAVFIAGFFSSSGSWIENTGNRNSTASYFGSFDIIY